MKKLLPTMEPQGIPIADFRGVNATYAQWKAWIHMMGKYQRHDLGVRTRRPYSSVYMNKGMAKLEEYCKDYAKTLGRDDRRTYERNRWAPSRCGSQPPQPLPPMLLLKQG